MPMQTEDVHRRTDNIFRSITDQFNPHLKTFVLAGRAYERALAGVSATSRQYFDSMNKLGMIASDSTSAKELGVSIVQIAETLRQIQLNYDETIKFFNNDILVPLENKVENDTKYVAGVQKKYQSDFKMKTDDLDKMIVTHKKLKRKSFSGKKPYKYDEKEKQLAESVAQRQKALDQFQHDNLKQAFVEERRRYCFFVEQQCELIKKNISCHQKAIDSLGARLPKWSESGSEVQNLPPNAVGLLDNVKPEDTTSIYSIPEPPTEPASQMNGYDSNPSHRSGLTPNMNRKVQDEYATVIPQPRVVNSTGYNVIPRESRKRVSAVYNHSVPGSLTQLSFEKGDIIVLMIPQPRDGWHYGENDRTKQRGWFPYSHTKLLEQYTTQEKPSEPIVGHMPLPPADYDVPTTHQNGNGWPAPPQDTGPDPYKQMKDQLLSGNPFANIQLRKNEPSDNMDNFSSFRSSDA